MTFAPRHRKFCYLIKASKGDREREREQPILCIWKEFIDSFFGCYYTTSHGLSHFRGTVTCNSTVMADYGV